MRKKLFTLLLATMASISALFAESGTCGDNLTWDLTNGVLTISGTGEMDDYFLFDRSPWNSYDDSILSVVIEDGVTSIGNYAFRDCSGLTSVSIPNSVTSIGDYTFDGCTGMTSITIPNSVTSIGNYAFRDCSGLTSVTIPNSVTSIGYGAFYDCSGMTSVTIGNGVQDIRNDAFSGCTSLTSVRIFDIAAWCTIRFGEFDSNPLYFAHNLYLNDELVTDLVIPENVYAIGNNAFYGCTSLTSVTIGDSVQYIGNDAFYGCTGLTSVTIGDSVLYIGNVAFKYCSSLTDIYLEPTTPPTIGGSTFDEINSNAAVHVHFGCVALYKSENYWKDMNIVGPIQSSVTTLPTSALVSFNVENIVLQSCGIQGGDQQPGNTLEYIGLEPNSEYQDIPMVLTANTGETETINISFTTQALELTTQPSKPVSSTTAILLANTNMSDAEVNCGFEYKRNDAPADMSGTKVYCPVAIGQMAGRLKNLKDDVYYKYRAFYQSTAGNMYYGDWQYIFTGDATIEFDPILYTYGATVVRENEATINGYALAGSEDFTEQGFEYWSENRAKSGASAPHRLTAALGEHKYVQASGISLRVTLTDLDAGTVYKYRVYGKVGDQYYYGAEQTFTTTGTYVPPTYMITFVNWDGTELQKSPVAENELPVYSGETPVRPEDEHYTYSFTGWTPSIVIATADATYTATYKAEQKSQGIEDVQGDNVQCTKVLSNGQIFILRGDKIYTLTGQKVK